ncbi:MAG: Sua5/YciO/YrdC/YwlC family protein, partial [SAR324 cluster bacterium]|nr:Sua5/YciO/YrdC/YwlC family protein [SAR324 cluster bacterium]
LYNKFCPGPITFILKLKKESKISKIATNKKMNVAVRFSQHPVMKKLLKKLKSVSSVKTPETLQGTF